MCYRGMFSTCACSCSWRTLLRLIKLCILWHPRHWRIFHLKTFTFFSSWWNRMEGGISLDVPADPQLSLVTLPFSALLPGSRSLFFFGGGSSPLLLFALGTNSSLEGSAHLSFVFINISPKRMAKHPPPTHTHTHSILPPPTPNPPKKSASVSPPPSNGPH